ncbi:MAG: addiction module toxin RelE [Gammaproteobacteria bacterium RIFCSPLOWO2_02_FULL_57_10]|nr:MAG: addiction module toxin RelE [Gammaproteobacteria bacterium RIFCSPLOWO2_02_FULL_57_10]
MQTIVELPEYLRKVDAVLGDKEKLEVIDMLARNPLSGVLLKGTGGIRKLRWQRPGSGKRGGARVIYYFCSSSMPLFLLTIFAKGDRSDLSKRECHELAEIAQMLRSRYTGRLS